MNKQYRIFKQTYYDDYGVASKSQYYIKKKKSFLGITYWRSIKHTEYGYGDCYKVTTYFKTIELAKNFIKDVLCKSKSKSKWVNELVEDKIGCGY